MQTREPIDIVPYYAFWMEGCGTLIQGVCLMLRISGHPVTRETIVRFVRSLPMLMVQLDGEAWKAGFCNEVCKEAFNRSRGTGREAVVDEIIHYFASTFVMRSACTKEMLHDSVLGVVMGLDDSFFPQGDE